MSDCAHDYYPIEGIPEHLQGGPSLCCRKCGGLASPMRPDREPRRESADPTEFYPTEKRVVHALLETDLVSLPGGLWVEPCAGTGRIIEAVNERRTDVRWIVNELNPALGAELDKHRRTTHRDFFLRASDFLTMPWPYRQADVLLMNPPFSLTIPFLDKAFERAKIVVCLQQQGWFGSSGRSEWLTEHCPDKLQLPWRPSFRPDGKTGQRDYCWYLWPEEKRRRTGMLAMLHTPARENAAT